MGCSNPGSRAENTRPKVSDCLNSTAGCWILVLPCIKHLLSRTETPQIRALTHRRVDICLSYDSPVCPAPSSHWQGISGDSRFSHKTQLCSAAVPGGFSCVAGWCRSKAIRCAQGRFRGLVPNRGFLGQSGAYRCSPVPWTPAIPYRAVTRSCAAALGVPRCIGYYMRKRSCRHTVAYGSLSLSVCVATLPYSGSTHRHSQELQCFLSRSPTLSGSFQKNLRLS